MAFSLLYEQSTLCGSGGSVSINEDFMLIATPSFAEVCWTEQLTGTEPRIPTFTEQQRLSSGTEDFLNKSDHSCHDGITKRAILFLQGTILFIRVHKFKLLQKEIPWLVDLPLLSR